MRWKARCTQDRKTDSLSFHRKKRVSIQRHFWHCGIPELLEFFCRDSSIVMRFVAVWKLGERFCDKDILPVVADNRDVMQPVFVRSDFYHRDYRISGGDRIFQRVQVSSAVFYLESVFRKKIEDSFRVNVAAAHFVRHFFVGWIPVRADVPVSHHECGWKSRAFESVLKINPVRLCDKKVFCPCFCAEIKIKPSRQRDINNRCGQKYEMN